MDPIRYGQLVRDKQTQLAASLPADSRTVKALAEYAAKEQTGGCAGCRRRRMLRWLANEIAQAPGPEKLVVDSVVGQV